MLRSGLLISCENLSDLNLLIHTQFVDHVNLILKIFYTAELPIEKQTKQKQNNSNINLNIESIYIHKAS